MFRLCDFICTFSFGNVVNLRRKLIARLPKSEISSFSEGLSPWLAAAPLPFALPLFSTLPFWATSAASEGDDEDLGNETEAVAEPAAAEDEAAEAASTMGTSADFDPSTAAAAFGEIAASLGDDCSDREAARGRPPVRFVATPTAPVPVPVLAIISAEAAVGDMLNSFFIERFGDDSETADGKGDDDDDVDCDDDDEDEESGECDEPFTIGGGIARERGGARLLRRVPNDEDDEDDADDDAESEAVGSMAENTCVCASRASAEVAAAAAAASASSSSVCASCCCC